MDTPLFPPSPPPSPCSLPPEHTPIANIPAHPNFCAHEADFKALNVIVGDIRTTLAKMETLLTTAAVLQERILGLLDAHKGISKRLADVEDRQGELEVKQAKMEWLDRVVWAIVAAALAGLFALSGAAGGGAG